MNGCGDALERDARLPAPEETVGDEAEQNEDADAGREKEELQARARVVNVDRAQAVEEAERAESDTDEGGNACEVELVYSSYREGPPLTLPVQPECPRNQAAEAQRRERAHRDGCLPAEDGERAEADGDVVRLVLVRVDRVVHDRPAEAARVQRQGDAPVERAGDGGPAEERAPVEGEAWTVCDVSLSGV